MSVVLFFGSGGVLLQQWAPASACLRLQDLEWMQGATPDALRETAHECLAFWPGDPHDAFGILQEYGDGSSVPHLRRALARAPKDDGRGLECTWIHGAQAYERALTQAKVQHTRVP